MATQENSQTLAQLEAILFYHGEPISFKKISSLLGIKEQDVFALLQGFQERMRNDAERGLFLLLQDDKAQLVTKPEFHFIFERLIESDLREELTPAAVETLSIISYLGPLSRAEIDYIRGVNSSFMVRNLFLRGLIERRAGKRKGIFYEYEASFNFLRHIGVKSVIELPEYEKYHGVLQKIHLSEENKAIISE